MKEKLKLVFLPLFIGLWVTGFSLSIFRPELLDGFLGEFIGYFFGLFIVGYIVFNLGKKLILKQWLGFFGFSVLVILWFLFRMVRKGLT